VQYLLLARQRHLEYLHRALGHGEEPSGLVLLPEDVLAADVALQHRYPGQFLQLLRLQASEEIHRGQRASRVHMRASISQEIPNFVVGDNIASSRDPG